MNFLHLIEAKRDGRRLEAAEIEAMVRDWTRGSIADYQMAAFLMAVCFRGLDDAETRSLTLAMRDSGQALRFPDDPRPLVDKHSTGGVGDKVSLVLAPLLASLGLRVPMISGRGLGITGGTLDKLESIPGFQTALPASRIVEIIQEVGCVICGQTSSMVPADKTLYALRDVTGTVPSIPLIVASILSKKLAEGISALVLDVKFGTGAFMPDQAKARKLARSMVSLGHRCGLNTRALLTNMNTPVGRSAGNWLEVKEAAQCLEGGGPDDLRELILSGAGHLLIQCGRAGSLTDARRQAETCLASGEPRERWERMIAAQGGNVPALRRLLKLDTTAAALGELRAPRSGYVARCDARTVGEVVRDLGGGRVTKDSEINPNVGVDALAKPGEKARKGSVLARVHAANEQALARALSSLEPAFAIAPQAPRLLPLIAGVIK